MTKFTLQMLFGGSARISVLHLERAIEAKGAFLLASNHISHFDPLILSAVLPWKIDWLAMAELFENRLLGGFLRKCDTFPADRFNADPKAVRTALGRLEMGRVVGIFPEGGLRTGPSSVLEGADIQPGTGSMAMMAGVPILPCVVIGADRLYDPKAWRRFRSVDVWIHFGELLYPNPDLPKGKARQELNQRLSEVLRDLYSEMKTTYQLRPEDLPTTAQRRKGKEKV